MRDYADMCMERDFNDYIDSVDHYYSEDGDFDDYPYGDTVIKHTQKPWYEINKDIIPYKDFPEGMEVLARRYFNKKLMLNRVCTIVRRTEKAVLFRVEGESDEKFSNEMFWMPKKNIIMLQNELRVIYFKDWAVPVSISNNQKIEEDEEE